MNERRWPGVGPIQVTGPGTTDGKLNVTSTLGFKVKQIVRLTDPFLNPADFEIKRVNSSTQLELGSPQLPIGHRSNLNAYSSTSLIQSFEQLRNSIPLQEIARATYEEEPTVAQRVMNVDPFGNPFTTTNPTPIIISDGTDTLEIDSHGSAHTVLYDETGQNALDIDSHGSAQTIIKDATGANTLKVDSHGTAQTKLVDATGANTLEVDSHGSAQTTLWDVTGTDALEIDSHGSAQTTLKDATGANTLEIDQYGSAQMTLWDMTGQFPLEIDAHGTAQTKLVDPTGANTLEVDVHGSAQVKVLDPTGANTLEVDAQGSAQTIVKDATGTNTLEVDSHGSAQTKVVDATGTNPLEIDSHGTAQVKVLDPTGANTLEIDVHGTAQTKLVDSTGTNTLEIDAFGSAQTTLWDVTGSNPLEIDPNGSAQAIIKDSTGANTLNVDSHGSAQTKLLNAAGTNTLEIDSHGSAQSIIKDATGANTMNVDSHSSAQVVYYDKNGVAIDTTTINSKNRLDANLASEGVAGSPVPFQTLQIGGTNSGTLQAASFNSEGAMNVAMKQTVDSNNTGTFTSANLSVSSPYTGTFTLTRNIGIVRQLVVLASTVSSGLGGTFTFQYSEDGINPTVSEARTIVDFSTVRDFDLLNAGAYFRVRFTPSRNLTGGETIFITTTQRRQDDGSFVRLLDQQLEQQNAAMPAEMVFVKGMTLNQKSVNILATPSGALNMTLQDSPGTGSGSLFAEGIRDDIVIDFSQTTSLSLLTNSSVGGTATLDSTNGQVIFATGATPGNSAVFYSTKRAIYEPGHQVRGEQTVELSALPTGNAYVFFGFGDANNGLGYLINSTGVYVARKKNGSFVTQVLQSSWNRDKCDGNIYSSFKFDFTAQALNVTKNNYYKIEWEWLGAAPPTWSIKGPNGAFVQTHVEEFPNQNNGTTVPSPALPLCVQVFNDTVSGGNLQVRSGSWRGGINSSKVALTGKNPNDDYVDSRVQGTHSGNSTSTPLGANQTWRGTWFNWQMNYIKMQLDMFSDKAGTLFIDITEVDTPTNGVDDDIQASVSYSYTPSLNVLRRGTPLQSKWVRARYQNGTLAQTIFQLDSAFLTNDPGLSSQSANILPELTAQVGLVRNIPTILNPNGTAFVDVPVASNGDPRTYVSHISDDLLIEPLDTALANQVVVGTTATRIDPTAPANRRGIGVGNDGPLRIALGHSSSITFTSGSIILAPGAVRDFTASETIPFWAIAENLGGVQTIFQRSGSSASGTATNPSNALTSNNVYANMTAAAQTITVTGFTAGTANALVNVALVVEANKTSGITQTVTFQEHDTGSGGNVTSVSTSGPVTAVTNHLYLVYITRRNVSATVTSVTGIGLTWVQLSTLSNGTNGSIDLWYAIGTPTLSGVVTANFSTTATNCHIAVSRYSNVKPSSPILDFQTGTGTNATPTTTGLISINNGMSIMGAFGANRTMVAGSGYTLDSTELINAGGSSDSLSVEHKALTTGGTETPTGTLSGNANWAAIGVSLTPADGPNPTATLSYKVSLVNGATSGLIEFSSTTDTIYTVDVTSDRSWVVADVPNVSIVLTGTTISTVAANIDWIYLQLTDTTGLTSRLSVWQGAKAVS